MLRLLCSILLAMVICLNPSVISLADNSDNNMCNKAPQTVIGNAEYPPEWFKLKWDPNNPETIARNHSETISVIGGVSPYTWEVSGTGFTLEEIQDNELSCILHADREKAIQALAKLIPDKKDRVVAMKIAEKVALADQMLNDEETKLLGNIRQALAI